MVIERCTHGMPNPRACWECMEDGAVAPPPKAPAVRRGTRTTAQYRGKCGSCYEPIDIGDPIAFSEAEFWICDTCAGTP